MTKMYSDDIHLGYTNKVGLIFNLGLHLNPYVLCEISLGSADESMLFCNKLVRNAHVMVKLQISAR